MATRNLEQLQDLLKEAADSLDVTIVVRINGSLASDYWSVDGLTEHKRAELVSPPS
jgi:hypothetical protein